MVIERACTAVTLSVRCSRYTAGMLWLLSFIYSVAVLTLFFSVGDIAMGHQGLLPAGATICALVSLLPLAFGELVRALGARRLVHIIGPVRRNAAPLFCYAAIAFCALTLSLLPGAVWDEGSKWIFLVPYGFAIALLALIAASNTAAAAALPVAGTLALALLLWSINRDLVAPGTFAALNERAAGFSGNANYSALVAVMLCAATLDYDGRRLLLGDLVVLILSGAIVIISLSRSGLLNFAVVVVGYLGIRFIWHGMSRRDVATLGISLAIVFAAALVSAPLFSEQLAALQQQSRFRRATASQQVDDGSAASRLAAARDALVRINESPILGHGTGYARRMPELPHNLYLQQWVNNGMPGLVSYLAFLVISLWQFASRRFFPGVMLMLVAIVGSFFSHNILDQRPFLILYGMLLGVSTVRCPQDRAVGSREQP